MEVYLVGGAVRDELLGLPVGERDWCVVGTTPAEMESAGFKPIGKDFPVFLHPDSGEEYALARTERKTAPGYRGFRFHTATNVSIAQDLHRRDLTINAMARDAAGNLIDPYDGSGDLEKKLLRHVSDAFAEDPVRILRVARFIARYAHSGFTVAPATIELMQDMVTSGEADALVPDRVWKETERALAEKTPHAFFETLRRCHALSAIYPEIDALFGVPQPEKWHPEIDCGIHTMMVVEQTSKLSDNIATRFAGLVHDLGKATTAKKDLPRHPGHERRSTQLVKKLASRLPVPNECRDLGLLVAELHTPCHRAFELRSSTILKVLNKTDAFRRPERFEQFLLACEADSRGRAGLENRKYPQADYFREAFAAASAIDIDDLKSGNLDGTKIGETIGKRRLAAIDRYKKNYLPPK